MSKKVLIGFIVLVSVVIVVGLGYLLMHNSKPSTSTSNSTTSSAAGSSGNAQNVAATITFSDSGFSPAQTTVKAGDTVAIKNTSSSELSFDSDPHPVHTDDTELNVGSVDAGQTKTFTVTKTGTFGFHDHLDPSKTGKITVQ